MLRGPLNSAVWVDDATVIAGGEWRSVDLFHSATGQEIKKLDIPQQIGTNVIDLDLVTSAGGGGDLTNYIISTAPDGVAFWNSNPGEVAGLVTQPARTARYLGDNKAVIGYSNAAPSWGAIVNIPGGNAVAELPVQEVATMIKVSPPNSDAKLIAYCTDVTDEVIIMRVQDGSPTAPPTVTIGTVTKQQLGGGKCTAIDFSSTAFTGVGPGAASQFLVLAVGATEGAGTGPGIYLFVVNVGANVNVDNTPFAVLTGHTGEITDIDFPPPGYAEMVLASGSKDGTVKIWQASLPQPGVAVPPPPGPGSPNQPPPPAGCFDVLSQSCRNDNEELCQQCVSSLGFIFKRAGCTDTDYAEYCIKSKPCDQALIEANCINDNGATKESCLVCAEAMEDQLHQIGCHQAVVTEECKKLVPKPELCLSKLNEVCEQFEGKGDSCFVCVETNVAVLQTSGCWYNLTNTYCQGQGGGSDVMCEAALDRTCAQDFQQGAECFKCLADNQADIKQASCSNKQLQTFCSPPKVPPPPPEQKCQALLEQACPQGFPRDQPQCLRCVVSKLDQLLVDCSQDNTVNYCMV